MDGITELAMMLKARNNPTVQGVCTGSVLSASPLKIAANNFVLEGDALIVAEHLLPHKRETSATVTQTAVGDHGTHNHAVTDMTFTDGLKPGDSVIVIPSADNQRYFIVGKVG